jgi:DNA-binding protein H-NS
LQKDLAKAISTYEDRHKGEARAKLEAIAKEMGYSLAELIGVEVRITRAPVAAKYRHPENPALTWSGRGRKPQWFVEALETGKTASDLAIS